MEFEKFEKQKMNVEMTGFIESGKQFDIEVQVPEDNRNVAFGIVKDEYGKPIENAVVKLIEVERMMGKEERKPVSHTFTNENGEFVFGPLCANKNYDLQIWVDRVKHIKVCHVANPKKQKCLRGVKLECKKNDYYKDEEKYEYRHEYERECDKEYDKDYDKKCEKEYDKKYDKKCEKEYDKDYDKKCEKEYDKDYDKKYDKKECKYDSEKPYPKKEEIYDCNCSLDM